MDESRETKTCMHGPWYSWKRAGRRDGCLGNGYTHVWGILSAKDCRQNLGEMASHLSPNMLYKLVGAEGAVDTDLESES